VNRAKDTEINLKKPAKILAKNRSFSSSSLEERRVEQDQ